LGSRMSGSELPAEVPRRNLFTAERLRLTKAWHYLLACCGVERSVEAEEQPETGAPCGAPSAHRPRLTNCDARRMGQGREAARSANP
jgi:hypothetical protein